LAYDSSLFRLYYKGLSWGTDPTEPHYPPVEMTITNPTRLVNRDPGESKLQDDSKLDPRDVNFWYGKDKKGSGLDDGEEL
jgi:hypothetical protein